MNINSEELARALGGRKSGRQYIARCPAHDDRTPSLSIRDGADGKVLVHCFAGCQQADVITALRRLRLWHDDDFSRRRPPQAAPKRVFDPTAAEGTARARKLWAQADPIGGTLGERYLNIRGLELDPDLAAVLGFHPRCPFGKGMTVPTVVGAFHSFGASRDESPTAIHRIGLTSNGEKIDKKMLGPVAGCAIKLDACEGYRLGVVEGFETALAVRQTGWRPVWALGSAGAIGKFDPLPGIDCLTIFADNDANGTGMSVARQCAERWVASGREVFIRMPREAGADWLDVRR